MQDRNHYTLLDASADMLLDEEFDAVAEEELPHYMLEHAELDFDLAA